MATLWKDRVGQAVATGGGTSITLGAALSGYQEIGEDATAVHYSITDGTAWETGVCGYTHSTKVLARTAGGLTDSSTGSLLTVTTAAKVYLDLTSHIASQLQVSMASVIPGGRLTLTSGDPNPTADQTSTTLYYTPYIHNVIPLWDGSAWVPTEFTERWLALGTLASATVHDVYIYLNSGTPTLELLIWTNDTTRASVPTLQDGRYCKSGDKTRLFLGTIWPISTTQVSDTLLHRGVANFYNKVDKGLYYNAGSSNHTWTSDNSTREYNGTSGVAVVNAAQCFGGRIFVAVQAVVSKNAGTGTCRVALGLNSSTSLATGTPQSSNSTSTGEFVFAAGAIDAVDGGNAIYLLDSNTGTADLTADWAAMNVMVNV